MRVMLTASNAYTKTTVREIAGRVEEMETRVWGELLLRPLSWLLGVGCMHGHVQGLARPTHNTC